MAKKKTVVTLSKRDRNFNRKYPRAAAGLSQRERNFIRNYPKAAELMYNFMGIASLLLLLTIVCGVGYFFYLIIR